MCQQVSDIQRKTNQWYNFALGHNVCVCMCVCLSEPYIQYLGRLHHCSKPLRLLVWTRWYPQQAKTWLMSWMSSRPQRPWLNIDDSKLQHITQCDMQSRTNLAESRHMNSRYVRPGSIPLSLRSCIEAPENNHVSSFWVLCVIQKADLICTTWHTFIMCEHEKEKDRKCTCVCVSETVLRVTFTFLND